MNPEFADNSSVLFGRATEVAYLIGRSRRPGVTAVIGQPQMGKSWLLLEVARRLATEGWREPAFGSKASMPLVGRVESEGDAADMLPRAVQDLYTRWLDNARYREQARVVFNQQKSDFVGRFGEAVGSLVESMGKAHGPLGGVPGGAVKKAFEGLASAGRKLESGGMQLQSLQTEDSRELLDIVYRATEQRPAVLIFDQWEKSPNLKKEASILDSFVRKLGEWPPVHILVGSRGDPEARTQIEELEAGYPEVVESLLLGPMRLEEPGVRTEMLRWLRERVPATRALADEGLLELIAGYPRVLTQWTSSYNAQRVQTREELTRVAEDANAYRYPEFKELLKDLPEVEQSLAIRLVLLPVASNAETWKELRAVALEGCPARTLDSLFRKRILLTGSPPTYGHAKRAEAALAWLLKYCHEEMRAVGESLVMSLAGKISGATPQALPYASSLAATRSMAERLELSPVAQALCESAYCLFQLEAVDISRFAGIAGQATDASVLPLMAMGLHNGAYIAKQREALTLRDKLLEELRELQRDYPGEAAVRAELASGLYNSVNDAKREDALDRRDALLEELRVLVGAYPADGAAREWLARSLYNTLIDVQEEDAPERRDSLLTELRELMRVYPQDAVVREWLARGLNNAGVYAKQENALARRDELLAELRELVEADPAHEASREQLAAAFFNSLVDAQQEKAIQLRDQLLDQLRDLARKFPGDAAVSQYLSNGLNNMLVYAKQENALKRRDALLEEERELARANPALPYLHLRLAMALNNTLVQAKKEDELDRRDTLLEELRELTRTYPAEAALRKELSNGLFNAFLDAKEEDALSRRDSLLEELRGLGKAYPAEAGVREQLARSLSNAVVYATQEDMPERLPGLLGELRDLVTAYPEDATVREKLAKGLYAAHLQAEEGEQGDDLMEELHGLFRAYPDDPFLRRLMEAIDSGE